MSLRALIPLVCTAFLLAACSGGSSGDDVVVVAQTSNLGMPIEGLTAEQLASFERGREVFERRFTPEQGLGPFYNATSCASCHSTPVTGGSAELYRNFNLAAIGTPGLQFSIPGLPSMVVPFFGTGVHTTASFSLDGRRPTIPETYFGLDVTVAPRNAISIFGTGLFETIPDATIMANADPDDLDGDGISGRFNRDNGTIGRFGVKAQSNNIELFTRAPLQNQMGITSNPFQGGAATASLVAGGRQISTDPNAPLIDNDGVADPEISAQDLEDLITFTRFLAPPEPKPFSQQALEGQMTFEQIGCAKCHIPALEGTRGPVVAYTDLLIHDLGPDLADGISMGSPQTTPTNFAITPNEFRTAPLWGVSLHAPFLHDGRAATLDEAIRMHAGEATDVTAAYEALSEAQRLALISFLEHL